MRRLWLVLVGWLVVGSGAWAAPGGAEPTLMLRFGRLEASFTRAELLARSDVTTLTLTRDPAFPGQTKTYTAVPVADLFNGRQLPGGATIEAQATDGFTAVIEGRYLLDLAPGNAVAYVAILPDQDPHGPFYLVWKDGELSGIPAEWWAWNLATFEVKPPLHQLFPNLIPAADASAEVQHGLKVYVGTCLSCHHLNREGASTGKGPDLNVPLSPTEYMTDVGLRTLIRNPQDVYEYPQSGMPSQSPSWLPDRDLDDLIAYLGYMAKHKVR